MMGFLFRPDSAIELMEVMLETWAWNMSRIAHTTQTESVRLGEHLRTTIDTEKEQGTSDSLVTSDSADFRTFRLACADLFGMQHPHSFSIH